YFILEGLYVPVLDDATYVALARDASRLSCPDDRFTGFAESLSVAAGPLPAEEREALRADIDARVAHAWGIKASEIETVFADFTLDAVPEAYRQRVRERF